MLMVELKDSSDLSERNTKWLAKQADCHAISRLKHHEIVGRM